MTGPVFGPGPKCSGCGKDYGMHTEKCPVLAEYREKEEDKKN